MFGQPPQSRHNRIWRYAGIGSGRHYSHSGVFRLRPEYRKQILQAEKFLTDRRLLADYRIKGNSSGEAEDALGRVNFYFKSRQLNFLLKIHITKRV